MKYSKILGLSFAAMLGAMGTSCNDFLEKEPMSNISPEQYYSSEAQIAAVVLDEYPNTLPSHANWSYGMFGGDASTDNQVYDQADTKYTKDLWLVNNTGGSWSFTRIYYINFLLSQTLPRYGEALDGSQNTISGNLNNIQHYIGEAYYLRAYQYFIRMQAMGDFPIITEPLTDDLEVLTEASARRPHNEVARFILEDLDKAAYLMSSANFGTTRLSRDAALLLKSRVALYEGTWLKYFKGTPFVPGGKDWPGAAMYPNYEYPSGSIDNEINYFLDQAIAAAKEVGDKYYGNLTQNTGVMQQSATDPANPYFNMFCDEDMSGYPEIILWRHYGRGLQTHNVNSAAGRGNYKIGLTRGYVQNFLMADGTPVYTHGSYADGDGYYKGDKTIADVRANRDSRLSIFLKEPGQKNVLFELDNNEGTEYVETEPVPGILSGDNERAYSTGYALRKGGNLNRKYYGNGGGYTGAPILRAAEALLNYMEAYYERHGSLDGTAENYWTALRNRAKVDPDYNKTISLTDMSKEAENDWGAYSAGSVLTDRTLYNIRRERRCELLSEGFRMADLRRWRSLDQLKTKAYHIEGFHIHNTPMADWYKDENGNSQLIYNNPDKDATISSPSLSEYMRPFEKVASQNCYNGCTWNMAHYLEPIAITQLLLTSPNGDNASESIIYQNPYWPTTAGEPALE